MVPGREEELYIVFCMERSFFEASAFPARLYLRQVFCPDIFPAHKLVAIPFLVRHNRHEGPLVFYIFALIRFVFIVRIDFEAR
jgi:hypothetical protein